MKLFSYRKYSLSLFDCRKLNLLISLLSQNTIIEFAVGTVKVNNERERNRKVIKNYLLQPFSLFFFFFFYICTSVRIFSKINKKIEIVNRFKTITFYY